jgi:hypothetical protein
MPRRTLPTAALLTAALLVLAGCTGTGVAPQSTTSPEPTAGTATPTASSPVADTPDGTATPTPVTDTLSPLPERPSNATARTRAIDAEKGRIRAALGDHENVTDLSFGILRPAEAEVRDRNETAVVVAVTVGYSVEFDEACASDGMATKTRYVVTADRTELSSIEQNVTSARGC